MGRNKINKTLPNPVGRPTVMTPEVLAKLEQVFAIDGTVEEALSYAEIKPDAYYDYLKKNPEFCERIKALREKPILKARQTVVTKLGESYTNAMDYLKRKKKLEFGDSIKTEIEGKVEIMGVDISVRK